METPAGEPETTPITPTYRLLMSPRIPAQATVDSKRMAGQEKSMTRKTLFMAVAAAAVAMAIALPVAAAAEKTGFGFNAAQVDGFRTGNVAISGGGAFDPVTGVVHAGGGFSCLEDVDQGPLTGCLAGEGVRWDTANLLRSTMFKCTGAASEALKPIATGPGTAVLQADFYRAGDANDESFTAQMIVSQDDIALDIPGVQNVWVQGVGCGFAVGGLNSGTPAG
jgi:hypothetical protein